MAALFADRADDRSPRRQICAVVRRRIEQAGAIGRGHAEPVDVLLAQPLQNVIGNGESHPSAPMIVTNHELGKSQTSGICGLTIGAWSGLWIWMSGSGRAEALQNWEAI